MAQERTTHMDPTITDSDTDHESPPATADDNSRDEHNQQWPDFLPGAWRPDR